ncbi:hypothetical protein PLICRDRAFT_95753 [Plicaturopsis crispa FD-325 SS-3]|uniref:Protein kinase domain-containing protein n=1 Tax=Plicaturopsis crispa FD-325 SS-3 TaxID=944288 RepID=A0A0C9SQI0_PLICR|nr:hypothetical protein PLICRDRAFT_95753 [Plicaturopsis crispa FD-325 SS-3]
MSHRIPAPPIHATSSESTVKVSSPLNPDSLPTKRPAGLPDSSSEQSVQQVVHSPPAFGHRSRGQSESTLRDVPISSLTSPSATSISIAAMSRLPPDSRPSPTSLVQRDRSKSPSYRDRSPGRLGLEEGSRTPPGGPPQSWWNRTDEIVSRPWRDTPKRKKTVPPEQTDGWEYTKKRVAEAAASVLGNTLDGAHEVLLLSVEVLRFAPIAGLEEAARTLLGIWDSLQLVDMNRLACLRLTERCADILLAVREEIEDAGNAVGEELRNPITKLVDAFLTVHRLLQKQSHRPFLKRYLKRDEILRQIAGCDDALGRALDMFSLSIQIRILKQGQAAERRRQADKEEIMSSIALQRQDSAKPSQLSIAHASPEQIRDSLRQLRLRQNELDASYDNADLRQLMHIAVSTNNDAEMIKVLQVGRDEMPEAIKTLQRALERVVEMEDGSPVESRGRANSDGQMPVVQAGVVGAGGFASPTAVGMMKKMSMVGDLAAESQDMHRTISTPAAAPLAESTPVTRDTLHREFLESGIDALRRLSHGAQMNLPSWTITRYEVDRDEKVGMGFFSDVYRGTWRGHTVALKQLAPTTPRKLFVHEISIWKQLQHPNVLELFGASSASSDPPWFFVSPYCKNGSLVTYLKSVPSLDDVDVLRAMHEIAKGMAYLHGHGVLHGDLKAANVLVDDNYHCLVSDFGQSEMKSEVYRVSGTPPPRGTLRWQAPEVLQGLNRLTTEVDVYAFAITCAEILTKGIVPWNLLNDDAVSRMVLVENQRPILPLTKVSSPALTTILNACWHRDPFNRPAFSDIERELKLLRIRQGHYAEDSPRIPQVDLWEEEHTTKSSPDMLPQPLPIVSSSPPLDDPHNSLSSDESWKTARGPSQSPPDIKHAHVHSEGTHIDMPVPKLYTPSMRSETSSVFTTTPESVYEQEIDHAFEGYESPPPPDEHGKDRRNERRYRMLLTHDYHPSLTLPLWHPAPVALGAVGFLSKPKGEFVTLFNSFDPSKSSNGFAKGMPSVFGYGPRIKQGSQLQDKRTAVQKGFDALHGLFRSSSSASNLNTGRRYSYPLRAGHKCAYICVETTTYNYVEDLDTPKKWFKANIDSIVQLYGSVHRIQKEDIFMIIGTLNAPEYGLFVSHKHPDGQCHFDVFSSPRTGNPWGRFSVDGELSPEVGGPSYREELPGVTDPVFEQRVSNVGESKGKWDSVLLARLRFKPDASEPTSL